MTCNNRKKKALDTGFEVYIPACSPTRELQIDTMTSMLNNLSMREDGMITRCSDDVLHVRDIGMS